MLEKLKKRWREGNFKFVFEWQFVELSFESVELSRYTSKLLLKMSYEGCWRRKVSRRNLWPSFTESVYYSWRKCVRKFKKDPHSNIPQPNSSHASLRACFTSYHTPKKAATCDQSPSSLLEAKIASKDDTECAKKQFSELFTHVQSSSHPVRLLSLDWGEVNHMWRKFSKRQIIFVVCDGNCFQRSSNRWS